MYRLAQAVGVPKSCLDCLPTSLHVGAQTEWRKLNPLRHSGIFPTHYLRLTVPGKLCLPSQPRAEDFIDIALPLLCLRFWAGVIWEQAGVCRNVTLSPGYWPALLFWWLIFPWMGLVSVLWNGCEATVTILDITIVYVGTPLTKQRNCWVHFIPSGQRYSRPLSPISLSTKKWQTDRVCWCHTCFLKAAYAYRKTEGALFQWLFCYQYRTAVPNLFDTRDRFRGRQFFYGPGVGGGEMVSGWFKHITFVVHFISIIITLYCIVK